MRIWRALAVPFDMASLIFVVIGSVLLALIIGYGLLAVFAVMILISWLFKYGFGILEHVAHGHDGAPVVTQELLGPFEIRPYVQAAVCAGGYVLVRYLDEPASSITAVVACLLLPAWVGLLGIADHLYQAFNPLMLWQMLRGMGLYYLAVLALIALACLAFVSVSHLPLWLSVRFIVMELCILASYSVIGEAIFTRRLELGFAPRVSPERVHDQKSRERDQLRQEAIDEIYTAVNARQYPQAAARLDAWLAAIEPRHIHGDVQEITAAVLLWRNEPGKLAVFQVLVGWLLKNSRPTEAVESSRAALADMTNFALSTEPATLALAEAVRSFGQPRLAFKVLENFTKRYPLVPLSDRAVALRAECAP
jgi:hypothetical protein